MFWAAVDASARLGSHLAVLVGREDHDAHLVDGRQQRLERADHELGADVSGDAPAGPEDGYDVGQGAEGDDY